MGPLLFNGQLPGSIAELPDGAKVRLRARQDDFTFAFVRTISSDGTTNVTRYALVGEPGGSCKLLQIGDSNVVMATLPNAERSDG